jgi:hypothetical protein
MRNCRRIQTWAEIVSSDRTLEGTQAALLSPYVGISNLPTTARLDELNREVATSLNGDIDGDTVEVAKDGAVVFRYNKSNESVALALAREYFKSLVCNLTKTAPNSRIHH